MKRFKKLLSICLILTMLFSLSALTAAAEAPEVAGDLGETENVTDSVAADEMTESPASAEEPEGEPEEEPAPEDAEILQQEEAEGEVQAVETSEETLPELAAEPEPAAEPVENAPADISTEGTQIQESEPLTAEEPVYAAGQESDVLLSLTVNPAENILPEDMVTVSVDITNNPGWCCMQFDFYYDTSVFELVSATAGDAAILSGEAEPSVEPGIAADGRGRVSFVADSIASNTQNGTLLNVSLRALVYPDGGSSGLEIMNEDNAAQPVILSSISGSTVSNLSYQTEGFSTTALFEYPWATSDSIEIASTGTEMMDGGGTVTLTINTTPETAAAGYLYGVEFFSKDRPDPENDPCYCIWTNPSTTGYKNGTVEIFGSGLMPGCTYQVRAVLLNQSGERIYTGTEIRLVDTVPPDGDHTLSVGAAFLVPDYEEAPCYAFIAEEDGIYAVSVQDAGFIEVRSFGGSLSERVEARYNGEIIYAFMARHAEQIFVTVYDTTSAGIQLDYAESVLPELVPGVNEGFMGTQAVRLTATQAGMYTVRMESEYYGWLTIANLEQFSWEMQGGPNQEATIHLEAGETVYLRGEFPNDHDNMATVTYTVSTTATPVQVCVSSESDTGDSVGLLSGGGNYSAGDPVTVTASAVDGYAFLGWFLDGVRVSESYTYSFTAEADVTLIARYQGYGTATLTLNNTKLVSVNGEILNGDDYSVTLLTGTEITLSYVGTEENFIRWCNESNMTMSTAVSMTFPLIRSMTVSALTTDGTSESTTSGYDSFVEFVSRDRQVMQASIWNSLDPVDSHPLPVGPSRTGMQFNGWSLDGVQEVDAAGILAAIGAENRHIVLQPLYSATNETCTVLVYHDGIPQTWYVQKGVTMTVSAMELYGKTFDHWENENGVVLSMQPTYSLLIAGDQTLYAVYATESTGAQSPVLAFTGVNAVNDGTAHKIAFHVTRSVPEGYTVDTLLVLVSDNPEFGQDGAEQNMVVGNGIPQAVATVTTPTGTLTVNKRAADDNTVYYARGYMLVTDPTGEQTEIYTPIVSGSYTGLMNR